MKPPNPKSQIHNPKCLLICVGSELLRGKINTHASTVARRLASIGLELHEENTVGDERSSLVDAIRHALPRFQIILITGGLGPTFDDITREAVAEATGLSLELSNPLLTAITKKFRRARYRMPPANARQAYLIRGAEALDNPVGTAPGQWLSLAGQQVIILMPGPPSELHPMLDRAVLPRLRKEFPVLPQAEAHLHFVGVPESMVDHKVRPLIAGAEKRYGGQVQFTILAYLGLVDFDIFVTGKTLAKAHAALRGIVRAVRSKLGKSFYGMDPDYPLEKVVGGHLRRTRNTLAIAESCTGGMLSARLTDIPGSSDYLLGGVVSYSNKIKQNLLGVPADRLKRYGAVSPSIAMAMAEGVRRHMGATVGLAITGIAGPGGATPGKPVGLVFIGISRNGRTRAMEYHFSGSRDAVRQRSVIAALDWLRRV